MKISQIAIYVPDIQNAIDNLNQVFGIDFYEDNLKMDGQIRRSLRKNQTADLHLAFNHTLMKDVELEFINSSSSLHWHYCDKRKEDAVPFLSHLGVYCETRQEFDSIISKMAVHGFSIIQFTKSYDHSNFRDGDVLESSRSYVDVIFDSVHRLGFNLKLSLKAELYDSF